MDALDNHPLDDGTLYRSWVDASHLPWKYGNFSREELSSRSNGEFYHHQRTFDAIQQARSYLGKPVYINSAHRDWLHNIAVGGAPLSAHLFIALDISLRGHDKLALYRVLKAVGFTSFGFYETFIHVDMRPGRTWFGSQAARESWASVLAAPEVDLTL